MNALLYSIMDCEHCAAARADLEARGVDYEELDVSKRKELVSELMKLTGGRRVVPVVVEGAEIRIAPDGGSSF